MYEEILNLLKSHKFSKLYRTNINENYIESETYGIVHKKFTDKIELSECSKKNEYLYMKLKELGNWICPYYVYTTIQVNKNVKCFPHKDKKNYGHTLIVGLGDYEGGELYIHDTTEKIDIKEKPCFFKGDKQLHSTCDFVGNRYTIMFFSYGFHPNLRNDIKCDIMTYKEIKGGLYESKKYDFYQLPNEYWIDIGSNIGLFSMKCRMNGCFTEGYEPFIDNYNMAITNCDNIKNYAIVSNDVKTKRLYICKNSPWNNTLYREVKGREYIDVECKAFYDIIPIDEKNVCIKMDIEGEELNILDSDKCLEKLSYVSKMVLAYHTNFDKSVENFNKRIERLKRKFDKVDYQDVSKYKELNFFPNEIIIYCSKTK